VREDPSREGLLYAGTEFGMFISFDNGAHWQSFQLNLPNIPINDIKVHQKDLVIATQGRSAWMIDNISVLHQLTPAVSSSQVTLFTPRDGYRTTAAPAQLGPQVEYFLPATPSDTVRLEILTATGAAVASYKSDAPVVAARGGRFGGGGDPDDPEAAMMEGRPGRGAAGPAMNIVTKTPGLNRFTWNVQNAAGLGMPPGTYQAKLTVGSTTQTVRFTVKIDPRLAAEGTTVADLQEQFDHNTRMRTLVADANATVQRARQAETRLKSATGAAADTLAKVKAVSEVLNTQPVRYGKPGLQAHISYLAGMTARGDQKVGRDALDRYQVLRKELDVQILALNKALGVGKIQ
jgi:hypothetical protein